MFGSILNTPLKCATGGVKTLRPIFSFKKSLCIFRYFSVYISLIH